MKAKSLEFYAEIEGRKTHHIFKQDEVFFVMTLMDEDKRGNFCAITKYEVNRVVNRIADLGYALFHPRDIDLYRSISDDSYREHRLRNICYILVAERYLTVEKVSREIQFYITPKLKRLQETYKNPQTESTIIKFQKSYSEYDYYNNKRKELYGYEPQPKAQVTLGKKPKVECPFCHGAIRKGKIEKHKSELCPKRPNK